MPLKNIPYNEKHYLYESILESKSKDDYTDEEELYKSNNYCVDKNTKQSNEIDYACIDI